MAIRTKIIVQQILNIDDTTTTASKYPKYTVVLGNSISSITAGELTAAIEAAAGSAAAAKDSEVAAKESELNAKDSENEAAISAGASEESASQSAASAAESERQAGLSKGSADDSAASALESKGFRDAAELAAQNAEQSRLLAEQAKNAAQAAQTGAETAQAGAEAAEANAAASAASAGEHAAAAKVSETNAKTSETNAAASEAEAGNQASNATTEADRAKAEADRAAQVVDSKLDKEDISGFIKVYKTKSEADADVTSRVLGEKVLVWNQTEAKYGWYKVAGTAEAPTLELVEVEQRLVSVNNVHADDAGNVQITLPGGNPSLWLGEVTWFPYDKDSGVGYPGVLPADGREVLRVDYPDTWEAIEAGLIPSVSEAEWQAGATLYFSTGDGSTTFRLPDMMQGQAFRAAAKGEENAGNIKEQIPYITSVNGVLPEDATGAIVLGLSSVEGTLPIAKGGTGATTKEAARTALEVPAASDVYTKAETYEKSELYTQTEVDDKLVGVKTQADTSYLAKTQNLSDLADRAAAWLNVRPIGSTPLAGDPVNDYDAVTKRWVENKINTGTIGPTMNGVMNYGVGDFHLRDSRSYIQPYEVVSDGQLLNRADWPELWAYAQMLTPIADADWLADPSQRGKYSLGDGSTTFRVPDRNGVQEGSIKGLFGRGDYGVSSDDGKVFDASLPNITASMSTDLNGRVWFPFATAGGAMDVASSGDQTFKPAAGYEMGSQGNILRFNASRSSAVYGRYGNTDNVLPRSFVGVWVIRASGGFVAANTSWTVYNSDQTLPPANTTAIGGVVRSEYQVGGSLRAAASFVARHTTRTDGSPTASLQIGVSDGSNSSTWWYKTDGHIASSTGRFLFDGVLNSSGNVEISAGEFCAFILEDKNSADADGVGKWWSWSLDGRYGSYFIKRLRGGVNTGQIVITMPSSAGTIALQGTSGIDFKHDIKDADLTEAMDRIEAMRMVNFIYNDDEENRVRFGIIAEEAELIAPQYIKHNQEPYEDILDEEGNKIGEKTRDRPSVDVNPIVMDLMGCVQALHAKIKALEARIAELESKE